MNQEDINEIIWKSTPQWKKDQINATRESEEAYDRGQKSRDAEIETLKGVTVYQEKLLEEKEEEIDKLEKYLNEEMQSLDRIMGVVQKLVTYSNLWKIPNSQEHYLMPTLELLKETYTEERYKLNLRERNYLKEDI